MAMSIIRHKHTVLVEMVAPHFPLSQHLPSPSHINSLPSLTAASFPLSQHLPSPSHITSIPPLTAPPFTLS
ncbi:unnamed protein product [Closterium sp. NIES-64]|nr:unnamed protein product [Closterium sp. NIES-64]CAI6000885.1 unnamed protein product [Closterium sp. NIES-64]